jgi:pimeloyl-ACP methyl ester carboxylesterase
MMDILSRDHYVPHRSTVPAIAGQTVNLFVRERSPADNASAGLPPIVFVHGGFWPGTLAFDAPLPGYSLMEGLARLGFATFAPDMMGYGRSPRPMMDDPANLSPEQRALIGVDPSAKPSYPFQLVNADSERADLDAVIDFVRARTGAAKVLLFGWSGGGFRTGTYAALHPEKVEALVIHASSNFEEKDSIHDEPPPLPKPGAAFQIQDRKLGEGERWLSRVKDKGQVEPHVPDIVWRESMLSDPVGATWGGGVLRSPGRTYWGWNVRVAARVTVPTLVIVGEEDRLIDANRLLFSNLNTDRKVFIAAASATHFMLWERGRRFLAEAAREWFLGRTFRGASTDAFRLSPEGVLSEAPFAS